MDEMHMLGYIVKSSAAEMEVRSMKRQNTNTKGHLDGLLELGSQNMFWHYILYFQEYLKANYCPTLDEQYRPQCEQNLADNYVSMLQVSWRGIVDCRKGIMLDIFPDDCQPLLC